MNYILYENGKKIGEISDWKLESSEPVYKDVLGKRVLSAPKAEQCSFISPKPVNRKSQLAVVENGAKEFKLQIVAVKGATFVTALIISQKEF